LDTLAQEEMNWNGNEFALVLCGVPPDHTTEPLKNFAKCQDDEIFGSQGYFIQDFYKKNSSECYSLGNPLTQPHASVDARNNRQG
jgi:hypothetical protein